MQNRDKIVQKRVKNVAKSRAKQRAIDLVLAMNEATDLQKILQRFDLDPVRMVKLLKSSEGQKQLAARSHIAKVHGRLLAQKFGPYSVQILTLLLDEKRPDIRLKGAHSILTVSGLLRKKRSEKKPENQQEPPPEMDPEYKSELMTAMTVALREIRRRRRESEACPQEVK